MLHTWPFMYRCILYQDDLFHDDVAMLINDDADADANMVSLDKIPFDNEIGDGVENELVMEQASGCEHREPTTPSQPDVEVYALLYILRKVNQWFFPMSCGRC